MLRKRTLLKNAVQVPSIAWGSLFGSAGGPLYDKIRALLYSNYSSGTMTINLSIDITKHWADSGTAKITKYISGNGTVIANDVAIPYSTTTSIVITPGQSIGLGLYLRNTSIEVNSYDNLDFNVTITSATISGVPVQITGDATWYMKY